MKCSLDTRTKYIDVVISLKNDLDAQDKILSDLKNWCTVNMDKYAMIMHDKDFDKESGEMKTPHFHLCGLLKSACRLSTTIRNISDYISVNPLAVSIEKLIDIGCGFQYLTHKNNLDKYQYDVKDVITNLNENEFNVYYESIGGSITIDRLIDSVCANNGKKHLIMRDIGLSYYHLYRNEISDLILAYSQNEFENKDLPF